MNDELKVSDVPSELAQVQRHLDSTVKELAELRSTLELKADRVDVKSLSEQSNKSAQAFRADVSTLEHKLSLRGESAVWEKLSEQVQAMKGESADTARTLAAAQKRLASMGDTAKEAAREANEEFREELRNFAELLRRKSDDHIIEHLNSQFRDLESIVGSIQKHKADRGEMDVLKKEMDDQGAMLAGKAGKHELNLFAIELKGLKEGCSSVLEDLMDGKLQLHMKTLGDQFTAIESKLDVQDKRLSADICAKADNCSVDDMRGSLTQNLDALRTALANDVQDIRALLGQKVDQSHMHPLEQKIAGELQQFQVLCTSVDQKADASALALSEKVQGILASLADKADSSKVTTLDQKVCGLLTNVENFSATFGSKTEALLQTVENFKGMQEALATKAESETFVQLEQRLEGVTKQVERLTATSVQKGDAGAMLQSVDKFQDMLSTLAGKADNRIVADLQTKLAGISDECQRLFKAIEQKVEASSFSELSAKIEAGLKASPQVASEQKLDQLSFTLRAQQTQIVALMEKADNVKVDELASKLHTLQGLHDQGQTTTWSELQRWASDLAGLKTEIQEKADSKTLQEHTTRSDQVLAQLKLKADSTALDSLDMIVQQLLRHKVGDKIQTQQKAQSPQKAHSVTVVSATGLRNADGRRADGTKVVGQKSDAFVIIQVEGKPHTQFHSSVIANSLDPVWNEEAVVADCVHGDTLVFKVYDKDCQKDDDLLGMAAIKAEDFSLRGFDGELQLTDLAGLPLSSSYLKVSVKPLKCDSPKSNGASQSLVTYSGSVHGLVDQTCSPGPVDLRRELQELVIIVAGKAEDAKVDQLYNELQRIGEVVGPFCRSAGTPLQATTRIQSSQIAPNRPSGNNISSRAATTYKHRPMSARSGR